MKPEWIGVLIEVEEPLIGKRFKPGWRCPRCGWEVGMSDLPERCRECGWREEA